MASKEFGARLARAILSHQSQIGRRASYAEVGKAVAELEGRKTAYGTTAVSEWVNGRAEPSLDALRALALTLGVAPCWLAFGDDVKRPDGQGATVTPTLPLWT